MTSYPFPRLVIDHARYWRGAPHQWSTQYFFNGSTPGSSEWLSIDTALTTMEAAVLFLSTGAGGFVAVKGYSTAGGPPVYTRAIGEVPTPSSWSPYVGSDWSSASGYVYNVEAEACVLVSIPLTGLSSKGKPVYARKFLHSVAQPSTSVSGAAASLPAGVVTAMETSLAILNTGFGSGGRRVISMAGRLPSSNPIVEPFLGNHQMPRGRKRKASSSSIFAALKDLKLTPEAAVKLLTNAGEDAASVG
jgi:hypothetical protein